MVNMQVAPPPWIQELSDLGFEIGNILKCTYIILSDSGHVRKGVVKVDGTVVEKNFIHLQYGDCQEISLVFITK